MLDSLLIRKDQIPGYYDTIPLVSSLFLPMASSSIIYFLSSYKLIAFSFIIILKVNQTHHTQVEVINICSLFYFFCVILEKELLSSLKKKYYNLYCCYNIAYVKKLYKLTLTEVLFYF